jgi:zinc transport system substrate-binding protein
MRCCWIALLGALLTACQPAREVKTSTSAADTGPPAVYAVNYPLAWMGERIGGDDVNVVFPAPDDVDPAHWQPSPETILDYQRADFVLLNGAGYAAWVQFASLSPGRLVDTSRALTARFVQADQVTHSHGPGGDHDHGNLASHTWLDPTFAAAQARVIADVLAPNVQAAHARLESLEADLAHLDVRLGAAFGGWSDAGVLYSHPVYQYLDARYRLNGRSVSWEPDEEPGEVEWQRLAERLRNQRAFVMLWESQPLRTTETRLRELGVASVVFKTGAATPVAGDYLTLMQANIDRLAAISINGGNTDQP